MSCKPCPVKLTKDFIESFEEVSLYYEQKQLFEWFNDNVCKAYKALSDENERLRGLLKVAKCPNKGCDNKGTIAVGSNEEGWEPEPCQWCDERAEALAEGGGDE